MSLYRQARRTLRPVRMALRPPASRRRLVRNARDDDALRLLLRLGLASDANCVDVGANTGHILQHIVAAAPRGRHIAFEPLDDLASSLRARFPQVDVRAVALSDTPAPAAEFIRPIGVDHGYSGLKERDYPTRPKGLERLSVPVSTLDDELPDDFRPSLIKIDVEGGEHDVLAGAAKTIDRHRPLIAFEHGPRASENYGVSHEQLFELLVGYGYGIYDMDGAGPFSRDRFVSATATFERFNFVAKP